MWHLLKWAVHFSQLANVAELKQFCKEERAINPLQQYERSIASYQKCLKAVAKAVTTIRARLVWIDLP